MHIALINVAPEGEIYYHEAYRLPHMGIAYLRSLLNSLGHDVSVFDGFERNVTVSQIIGEVRTGRFDIIGCTTYANTEARLKVLLREIYDIPGRPAVILGGVHASFVPETFLQSELAVDVIFYGEADHSLVEFLQAFRNDGGIPSPQSLRKIRGLVFKDGDTVYHTERASFEEYLDTLPYPIFNVPEHLKEIPIVASRGCAGNCTFCSARRFQSMNCGVSLRCREPEHLIEEIRYRLDQTGINRFMFSDDDLFLGELIRPGWIARFAEGLASLPQPIIFGGKARADTLRTFIPQLKELRHYGLNGLFIGVESSNEETLKGLFAKRASVEDNQQSIAVLNTTAKV
jgi:radical SAM superfamily enzyme YgiQ (UPF0313 family)